MTILFAGQEDLSFQGINSTISTGTASIAINTTNASGQFRSGFARCSINCQQNALNGNFFIRNGVAFTSSSFWTSGRFWSSPVAVNPASGWSLMRWCDSSGNVRLLIKTSNNPANQLQVYKQDASGAQTQLGSTTLTGISLNPSTPDKLDVFINYSVSGTFTLYVNGYSIFTYSGDVTTNSVLSLAYVDYGMAVGSAISSTQVANHWSECIVATQDTRNMSLVTQAPLTNGNTAAWTTSSTSANITSTGNISTSPETANTVYYIKFTMGGAQNGTLTSLQVPLSAGLTGTLNMAIYSDSSGPNTRLGQGSPVTNPSAGSVVFSISGVNLLANTVYWVAIVGSATWSVAIGGGIANAQYTQATASFPSTAAGIGPSTNNILCQLNFTQPSVSLQQASQSGPDSSSTATQVQQYQAANTIPTGNFSVISVVQHGQCTLASGGPQHVEFGVRSGSSDYFSPDLAPNMTWSLLSYNWDTNPNTSVAWATTDLAASSTAFNMGYKSTT